MVRMSALRNYPVICSNRQIGLLQSLSMDTAQKQVEALVISCGIRGKRIALQRNVLSLADGFILVRETGKYQRSFETKPCCLIRDTSGLLTGRVTDYAISTDTWKVIAIEMLLGYSPSQRNKRIWVYDYKRLSENENELTVPSSLGSELIISEEGNRICACQP